jgi:sensor c-di-GMP phosphodiesterase-like protein
MARLGGEDDASFFDGHHLVTMQRSDAYDLVAYVAVPVAYLRSRLYASAIVLVPIGLVLGSVLWLGILKLARQRTSLAAELRTALKRREFVLRYQPIVELDSSRIVGVEALLRWPSDAEPRLRPDLFIPAAEACGLIGRFTEYVIEQVAVDLPRLLAVQSDCYVSINLASADLHSESIVGTLRKLVETPGIRPTNIIVEATEHSFVDPGSARRAVTEIRALGIRVAIDDFGTGYSSLSHLTNLQTDFLKIDRVFVEAVGTDSATNQVASHIIQIAKSLRLKVTGEGVETEEQAEFLREHGVELAQGWLFSKALPIERLLPLLTQEDRAAWSAA